MAHGQRAAVLSNADRVYSSKRPGIRPWMAARGRYAKWRTHRAERIQRRREIRAAVSEHVRVVVYEV